MKSALSRITRSADSGVSPESAVRSAINSRRAAINDEIQRAAVMGARAGIENGGYAYYRCVCSESDSTCAVCSALHNKCFALADAEEGVNYPLMHPNCRCNIQGYKVDSDKDDNTAETVINMMQNKLLARFAETLYNQIAEINPLVIPNIYTLFISSYSSIFRIAQLKYYFLFGKEKIDGEEYKINYGAFNAITVTEDGRIIGKVSENQREMLRLMKMRDAIPADDPRRKAIVAELAKIHAESSGDDIEGVDPDKKYDYYVLYDVTERFDSYMEANEETYEYMHEKGWAENLSEFYILVRAFGITDLKEQPEWQHSAFIYNGEIVDQDSLGNINYGYFGTFCNIPEKVLLGGGGYVQQDGKWYSFKDDPRDSYRIEQGITIYNYRHRFFRRDKDEDEAEKNTHKPADLQHSVRADDQYFDIAPYLI